MEEIIDDRKTIEERHLKLRFEEMITNPQKYDLLRAIYLLERMASYKTKNLEEKELTVTNGEISNTILANSVTTVVLSL